MERLTDMNGWSFEVTQIKARKTETYGEPYTAIATITIADGTPHIEGLLSVSPFKKSDFLTIKKYLNSLGFTDYKYRRFKNNRSKRVKGNT